MVVSQIYHHVANTRNNVLAMRAQMAGLYPSARPQDTTDWAQRGSFPPPEGADFEEYEAWAAPLPHGLQTYPVAQIHAKDDFMMAVGEGICSRFEKEMEEPFSDIRFDLEEVIEKEYKSIFDDMRRELVSGTELCDYLTWAHHNAIPLKGGIERNLEFAKLAELTCPTEYYHKVSKVALDINERWDNLLASNFMTNLINKVEYAKSKAPSPDNNHLVFSSYHALTVDIVLAIATQALEGVPIETLPASSTLVFEVSADHTVRGFLNNKEYTLAGCAGHSPCAADLFAAALSSKAINNDVRATCDTTWDEFLTI